MINIESSINQEFTEFKVVFTFEENPYIKNSKLEKTFDIALEPSAFGCRIKLGHADGQTIDWIDQKIVVESYWGKERITIKHESFFHFFDVDDEDEAIHENFSIAKYIHEDIIPKVICTQVENLKNKMKAEDRT